MALRSGRSPRQTTRQDVNESTRRANTVKTEPAPSFSIGHGRRVSQVGGTIFVTDGYARCTPSACSLRPEGFPSGRTGFPGPVWARNDRLVAETRAVSDSAIVLAAARKHSQASAVEVARTPLLRARRRAGTGSAIGVRPLWVPAHTGVCGVPLAGGPRRSPSSLVRGRLRCENLQASPIVPARMGCLVHGS